MHVGLFGGFGVLCMGGLPGALARRAGRMALLGLLLAAATEIMQGLLPLGRTASLLDALADALGLALAIGAFAVGARLRRTSRSARAAGRASEK